MEVLTPWPTDVIPSDSRLGRSYLSVCIPHCVWLQASKHRASERERARDCVSHSILAADETSRSSHLIRILLSLSDGFDGAVPIKTRNSRDVPMHSIFAERSSGAPPYLELLVTRGYLSRAGI